MLKPCNELLITKESFWNASILNSKKIDLFITRSDWVFFFLSKRRKKVIFECHGESKLRKLLLIKTILKKTGHIAISGFLEQSKDHKLTATQAFTELGPIGLLPF